MSILAPLYTQKKIIKFNFFIDFIANRTYIDHITVTGLFIQQDGYYKIANQIYKKFLEKLHSNDYLGDFCVFHSLNETLWNRSKIFFSKATNRKIDSLFPTHLQNINRYINHLKAKIHSCHSSSQLMKTFIDIISLNFNISCFNLFKIEIENNHQFKSENITDLFNDLNRNLLPFGYTIIKHESINKHLDVISKAMENNTYQTDWTGELIFIPIRISKDFLRLFIAKVPNIYQGESSPNIYIQGLNDFVLDAMLSFYELYANKQGLDHLFQQLNSGKEKNEITPYSRNEMQGLWSKVRTIIHQLGI